MEHKSANNIEFPKEAVLWSIASKTSSCIISQFFLTFIRVCHTVEYYRTFTNITFFIIHLNLTSLLVIVNILYLHWKSVGEGGQGKNIIHKATLFLEFLRSELFWFQKTYIMQHLLLSTSFDRNILYILQNIYCTHQNISQANFLFCPRLP